MSVQNIALMSVENPNVAMYVIYFYIKYEIDYVELIDFEEEKQKNTC